LELIRNTKEEIDYPWLAKTMKKISTTHQEVATLAAPDALQTLHQSQRVELEEWLCNNISVVNKGNVVHYSEYFVNRQIFSVEDITAELLEDSDKTLISDINKNFGAAARIAFTKLLNKLRVKAAEIGVDVGYCMLL
jgi:hypothetical protein